MEKYTRCVFSNSAVDALHTRIEAQTLACSANMHPPHTSVLSRVQPLLLLHCAASKCITQKISHFTLFSSVLVKLRGNSINIKVYFQIEDLDCSGVVLLKKIFDRHAQCGDVNNMSDCLLLSFIQC